MLLCFIVAEASVEGYIQQVNHGTAGGQGKPIGFDVTS